MKKIRKLEKSEIQYKTLIHKRIAFLQFCIFLAFFILLIYLFSVQVFDFSGYKKQGIAIRNTSNLTLRGNILDRNGLKLATDELVYEIYAHPLLYSNKTSTNELAQKLSPYLKISTKDLITLFNSKKINIITLKKNVDRKTADEIKKLNLREISVGTLNKRFYPQGSVASHILGYYSHLSQNSIGIENIANEQLSNVEASESLQRRAGRGYIFDLKTNLNNVLTKQKGEDVQLTIDIFIQYICEKELKKTITKTHAQRGSVIVMNVKNGEILAYASYPNFDPNNFSKCNQLQMKNWSLTDIYPPGSTFKIITVATAIELGAINECTKVLDTGKMTLEGYEIKNYDYHKKPYPGYISLDYLFEHSSNVGSANLALMLTPNQYYSKLRDFGFGQKTNIDLTAESIGLLPKPNQWYKSRQASMGYGYGASVTAIQMISAVSAIANNGVWTTPHVIKYSQEELPKHVTTRQVMSSENAKSVTKLLAKSIENGKSVLKLDKYYVAAKTGTSRKEVTSGANVYTSAIGYFPASNPEIAIYVVIDSPKTGSDWGSTIASPLFREIALEVANILCIPADK